VKKKSKNNYKIYYKWCKGLQNMQNYYKIMQKYTKLTQKHRILQQLHKFIKKLREKYLKQCKYIQN